MSNLEVSGDSFSGLYQSADQTSLNAQQAYFWGLFAYLTLLVTAALVSFIWPLDVYGALGSASLFLVTLTILIALRVKRPDDLWYNGRAVAESVKTRSWRWMMRAEPYEDSENVEIVSKQFINDLKAILSQNKTISSELDTQSGISDVISETMIQVRKLPVNERLEIYLNQRVKNQADWYSLKSIFNRKRAQQLFWFSVVLHGIAIAILLYRIKDPSVNYPVEVIATTAGAVLTWLQAKKHNELGSSYALAAHEIVLIKGEGLSVKTEESLSDFVLSSETAFSREHTQWAARKAD